MQRASREPRPGAGPRPVGARGRPSHVHEAVSLGQPIHRSGRGARSSAMCGCVRPRTRRLMRSWWSSGPGRRTRASHHDREPPGRASARGPPGPRGTAGLEILTKLSFGGVGEVLFARRRGAHGLEKRLALKIIKGARPPAGELQPTQGARACPVWVFVQIALIGRWARARARLPGGSPREPPWDRLKSPRRPREIPSGRLRPMRRPGGLPSGHLRPMRRQGSNDEARRMSARVRSALTRSRSRPFAEKIQCRGTPRRRLPVQIRLSGTLWRSLSVRCIRGGLWPTASAGAAHEPRLERASPLGGRAGPAAPQRRAASPRAPEASRKAPRSFAA